jgi:uncharacterized repeat protein (TIGR01451 family)
MRKGYLLTIALTLVGVGAVFATLRTQVVLSAPVGQNQPNGSTIASPQTTNGTWGPGTITATGNVAINAGVVITIAPNTTIRVVRGSGSTRYGITVNGDLHSDGPVTFTSAQTSPAAGDWVGITYAPGSSGYLNAATVQYGQQAIILNTANPITISNSALRYNQHAPGSNQTAYGAGLTIQQGNHLISGTSIYSNSITASGSGPAYGAGIYIAAGAPQVRNCQVYQNVATGANLVVGGGIGILAGGALIAESQVTTNTITGSGNAQLKLGAGIGVNGSTTVVIRDNWIAGNATVPTDGYAGGGGIGLNTNAAVSRIESNMVYANSVVGADWCEGAGIDVWETGSATIVNNLVISNTTPGTCASPSPIGGGANINAGTPGVYLYNNTWIGNQAVSGADGRGGGLHLQLQSSTANIFVFNNVVVNNRAGSSGGGIYRETGTVDYNDIFSNMAPSNPNSYGTIGANNPSVDPLFVAGGDLALWYHLRQGSPVIDAGTNTGTGLPNDDYEDDTRPLGTNWDIGFDEVNPFTCIKSVTPTVFAGDALAYTVVVTNPDPRSTFVSGWVTDVLPLTTTYYAGPACNRGACGYSSSGRVITWTGDVPLSGGALILTYTVLVDPGVSEGTVITNSALITVGTAAVWTNVVTTTVRVAADLAVSKADSPDPVVAGTTLTYTLVYTNAGPSHARNVAITDTLPGGVVFGRVVSASPPISLTGTSPPAWYTPTLRAGVSGSIVFTATVNAGASGIITNSAVIASSTLDLSPGNNRAEEPTTVLSPANLRVDKTDSPDPVVTGATLTYTVNYTNSGGVGLTGVVVTETYDANVRFVSASPPPSAGNNVWNVGALSAGASGRITIMVAVNPDLIDGTLLNNTVRASSNQIGTVTATQTTLVRAPVLGLAKMDDPDPVDRSSNLVYTLAYANSGGASATGVVITETYDSNVNFASASPPPSVGNNVWQIGTLGTGGSGTIVITVTVNGGTTLANVAVLDSDQTTPITASATSTVRYFPVLNLAKSDDPDPVGVGDSLVYSITYGNSGGVATGIVITETYDGNVSFVSADPWPDQGNNVWRVGTLGTGEAGTIVVTVTVNGGALLTNRADIGCDQGVSGSVTEETSVLAPGQVTINKEVSPSTVQVAGLLVTHIYTITISNAGPSTVRVRQITDTLPAGFTYIATTATSVIPYPDTISVSGQDITWSYRAPRPAIPARNSATLTFVATSTTDGGAYCNSAGVTIQGSIGVVARDNLACVTVAWPMYEIVTRAGPLAIQVRVRMVNGQPVILSWEFLP